MSLSPILPGDNSHTGGRAMAPTQFSPHDVDNARVALILIVASTMLFGRTMLRVALAILVVAAIVGAVTLLQGVHL
jgi:hypothetical protein